MANEPDISRGVVVVALMALSKRQFFQRLLDDPQGTLSEAQAELGLENEEVRKLAAMIEGSSREIGPEEALGLWDTWRATGKWARGKVWPMLRPPWPL